MVKKKKAKDPRPFSERHPRLNLLLGLVILCGLVFVGVWLARWLVGEVIELAKTAVSFLSSLASKFDAVVIVALITGAVSILGVIISSIVAKLIEHKKSRQEYLAKKREAPYGEFVDMVYKIQQNGKKPNSYTQEEMVADLLRFSKTITLWGSPTVVKKWNQFRENASTPNAGQDNLFLMEEIMNEMRKDLGMKKVKKGMLLGFFINDIKEAMKKVKK